MHFVMLLLGIALKESKLSLVMALVSMAAVTGVIGLGNFPLT